MNETIYVLSNISILELVKIGFTTGTASNRARQLSSTGVPTPFIVEFEAKVKNGRIAERHIHENLRQYRYNKEFFRLSPVQAIAMIQVLNLEVFESKVRSSIQSKVNHERKTYEEVAIESENVLAIKNLELQADFDRKNKIRLTTKKIAGFVGWPFGLCVAYFAGIALPDRIGDIGRLLLAAGIGSSSGVIVGFAIAEFLVQNNLVWPRNTVKNHDSTSFSISLDPDAPISLSYKVGKLIGKFIHIVSRGGN